MDRDRRARSEDSAVARAARSAGPRATASTGPSGDGNGRPQAGQAAWRQPDQRETRWPAASLHQVARRVVRSAGRTSYEHDAEGRLVRRTRKLLNGQTRTWTYTWNAEDRLTEATVPDGSRWRLSSGGPAARMARGDDPWTARVA